MINETTGETKRNEKRRRKPTGKGATVAKGQLSPKAVARLERDRECVRLRGSGMDWYTIRDRLGYSSTGHAHDRFMKLMRDYPREDVQTARNLLIDRHEACIHAMWDAAMSGNGGAVDRVTRSLEALARLLLPHRAEPDVSVAVAELDAALRELDEEMRLRAQGQPIPQE